MKNQNITENENRGLRQLPLTEKTQKIVGEVKALFAERDAVNPAIDRIMTKIAGMDTDTAVQKLTPLRVKQEIIGAKLDAARKSCFAAIVEDSQKWETDAAAEAEKTRLEYDSARINFIGKVNAAFHEKDARRMLKDSGTAGSVECREVGTRRQQANETSSLACAAHKLLDREFYVKLVAAGLCASTGRQHVMPVEWYWINAAEIVPELIG